MEHLLWRVRVSVLWLALAIGMSATMILVMVTPGNSLIAGEMEGAPITTELLFLTSLFWLVPLGMSILTLALEETAARWTNAVMALVATVLYVWDLTESLAGGASFSAEMLMTVAAVVFAALIGVHAWKWPVETGSTT